MIQVTKLNKLDKFWVNEALIEFMEETPDTVLSMATGRKVIVAETAAEISRLCRENGCALRTAAAVAGRINQDLEVENR